MKKVPGLITLSTRGLYHHPFKSCLQAGLLAHSSSQNSPSLPHGLKPAGGFLGERSLFTVAGPLGVCTRFPILPRLSAVKGTCRPKYEKLNIFLLVFAFLCNNTITQFSDKSNGLELLGVLPEPENNCKNNYSTAPFKQQEKRYCEKTKLFSQVLFPEVFNSGQHRSRSCLT